VNEAVLALFTESDPVRNNLEIFQRLVARLGLPVQDVRLSMPRIFDNRRFEIISFTHPDVSSVFELRSEDFHGFYLTHINDQNILLVYARQGKHIEWGPKRCLLEAGISSEPNEFQGGGLLGLAQDQEDHFIFVVVPAYKQWVKPHEKLYQEVDAYFMTVQEFAGTHDHSCLIWPDAQITYTG
jgi:hypothetical protein